MIDPETKRTVQGILLSVFVGTCLIGSFIYAAFITDDRYTIVVSEMPKRLICQPFSQPGNDYYRAKEGYKPVMWQELNKAFLNQSQGKGEVIGQTNLICFEKLGSSQTVSADMYFYRTVSK